MGRAPCCDKASVKKGPWSPEEDAQLREYIEKHGTGGNWIALPQKAGLKRCGKSCRLRWLNYLRPNIKHGEFSHDEDRIICSLFASIGSRWSVIASQLPGRTDNDIKNYWNTKLKKKMMGMNVLSAHHQATLLSLLQNSASSSSSSSASSPLSFTDSTCSSYCHPPYASFTAADQSISFTSTTFLSGHSSCASAGSFYQPQESLMSPIQNYQVKDGMFMFGGDAASCSSSNGNCNNSNQMSHVKEAEAGYGGDHGTLVEQMMMTVNNYEYLQGGMEMEESQKVMGCDGDYVSGWTEKQSGLWEETPTLDDGIEEIKQLISTSSCNNFLFDENMTQKRALYYF